MVIDCTGVVAAIEDGLTRVRRGGTFQQFGVAPTDATATFSPFRVYNDEITIVGSMAVLNCYARAVEMFAAGALTAGTDGEPRLHARRLRPGAGDVPRRHAAASSRSGPGAGSVELCGQLRCDCGSRGATTERARREDRQAALIGLVARRRGRLDVITAADRLGVAQETVRRDLRALERPASLQRVHGGAVNAEPDPIPALGRPATVEPDDPDWPAPSGGRCPGPAPSCSAPAARPWRWPR